MFPATFASLAIQKGLAAIRVHPSSRIISGSSTSSSRKYAFLQSLSSVIAATEWWVHLQARDASRDWKQKGKGKKGVN